MFRSNKNCTPKKVIPFLVLTAVVFWLIWFGTGSLITKVDVEQGLQRVSNQLDEIGKPYGRNVKLTHGDIVMEGWGYQKRAVVNNLVAEISVTLNPVKIIVTADKAIISSDPLDFRRMVMRIPGPLTVSQNDSPMASVEFSEPFMVSYKEQNEAKSDALQSNIFLPKKIAILKAIPTGGFQAEEQGMVISFAEIPALRFVSSPIQGTSTTSYNFTGLSVVDKSNNMITIGNVENNITKVPGDAEGRVTGKNLFKASDIVVYRGGVATKPYAVNMDADITVDINPSPTPVEGDISKRQDLSNNMGPDENREVSLNDFTLTSPDFKLNMSGKFANIKGDPLPSGDMVINIDNLQQLMNSELATSLNMGGMEGALAKVTGQPVSAQTAVTIPLKREKGGTLYIGQTTFEEMMAAMLSGSMLPGSSLGERLPETPQQSPDATIVPPVDLPVSAPQPE